MKKIKIGIFGARMGIAHARTLNAMSDLVEITALCEKNTELHDKFDEIIAEAQKSDSIFNAEGVIYAEYERQKQVQTVQSSFLDTDEQRQKILEKAGLDFNKKEDIETYRKAVEIITITTATEIKANPSVSVLTVETEQ